MSAFLFDPDRHAAQDCHLNINWCGCGPTWSAASSSAGSPTFCVCRRPNALKVCSLRCFAARGYPHIAERGQAGYHGTAVLSRLPIAEIATRQFCGKDDACHIAVRLTGDGFPWVHSLYVPAGGDLPDLRSIPNSPIRSPFSTRCGAGSATACTTTPHILTGDFNVAPLEHDVWSHRQLLKVVSHTPIETERLVAIMAGRNWYDVMRAHVPHTDKLYTWWSYRARDCRPPTAAGGSTISGSMPATATTALRSRSCARPAAGSAPPITSRSW